MSRVGKIIMNNVHPIIVSRWMMNLICIAKEVTFLQQLRASMSLRERPINKSVSHYD